MTTGWGGPWTAAALAVALVGTSRGAAQQVPDTAFAPPVGAAAFARGEGPRVALDEAHVNFHTLEGRYRTFGRLLAADGFRVRASRAVLDSDALRDLDLLVVANALHPRNEAEWSLPTPSAFTPAEIEAVRTWVEGGGSLLLIADHMPFPGAAAELASAFGFELLNGFAIEGGDPGSPIVFRRGDGSLGDHPVTRGVRGAGAVDSVASFTGEAFRIPSGATSLLTLRPGAFSLQPRQAWEFDESTPRTDVGGWSQGAVARVGAGRVAVFGEAAMFSAQLAGPQATPFGMNAPVAAQNPRFLLSLVRWLTGGDEGS
jgi:hypothetical protein